MTPHDQKMLVLGTSGRQGGAVARHLLEKGFTNVHALVRTAESAHARLLAEQGITLAIGDLDDRTSLEAAMQDASGVFAVLPLRPDRSRGGNSARQERSRCVTTSQGAAFHLQFSRRSRSQ